MRNSSRKAIERPIIKKCTLLYEMILDGKKKAPRDIQHSILDSTIETAHRLYIQAFRQARGKDYLKRATDTLEEIQADIYLVMLMHGWSKDFCAKLDVMCDDIEQCLYASAESAQRLLCSINSYTGMMCHTASFNQQKMLAYMVLSSDFCKYLYFVEKKNHLVCQLFPEYKPAAICKSRMEEIDKQYKQFRYEYRSKSKCSALQCAA